MDLLQFCGKQERHARYGVNQPFSKGEYTYATDGCLCIRVARLPEVTNEKGPDADRLFNEAEFRPVTVWQPLPQFELKHHVCDWCGGKGYLQTCPAWNNPKLKCSNGEGKECEKYNDDCSIGCDASAAGSFRCEDCEGTGTIPDSGDIIVDGSESRVKISAIYLDKIKYLPNIQIAPYDATSSFRIKFDGGDGLLMPMRMD